MEQLPRLKARISSLQELRDLVRAFRMLAASRVQEAQAALAGIEKYAEIIEGALAEGVGLLRDSDKEVTASRPSDTSILIVVCSEHGFAGAFNEQVLNRAKMELEKGQGLGIVGRRGAMLAEERGLDLAWSFPMATHIGGILETTRRVAEHLAAISTADIVFSAYQKGGNYNVVRKNILPLDPAVLARSAQRSPPLHHLAPAILLQRLADEYLFAEITRAVVESLASENAARLRAMQTADHNIGDKLDDLYQEESVMRQEAITSELLDVVTGSEAILGSADS